MQTVNADPRETLALIPSLEKGAQLHKAPDPQRETGFATLLNKALEQPTLVNTSPETPPVGRYEVQSGDTLVKISQKLGLSQPFELAQANKLPNPDQLAVGQVLTMPRSRPESGADAPVLPPAVQQASGATGGREAVAGRGTTAANREKPGDGSTYVVQAGDTLWSISQRLGIANPGQLASLNQLRNPDQLQVGQVLTLPGGGAKPRATQYAALPQNVARDVAGSTPSAPLAKSRSTGRMVLASWYGGRHHGQPMANGRPFNMYADTVAHRSLPLGTEVKLTNPVNGSTAQAVVTDRGPFVGRRDLDVSYGVAQKLGMVQAGVARLYLDGG